MYGDDAGPTCFGLDGEPIRPFAAFRNPDDGYRDGKEVDPQTGLAPGVRSSPLAAARRAAVQVAAAPALGLAPGEVPDVACCSTAR